MNMQMFAPIDKPPSLWAATAIPGKDHPCLSEAVEADVAVIGAGFTGLRAALKLSEAGISVVVLDAGDVAYGASGRTGGQVNPMLPFNTPDRLRKLLGQTYFERLTETSLGTAERLVARLPQQAHLERGQKGRWGMERPRRRDDGGRG